VSLVARRAALCAAFLLVAAPCLRAAAPHPLLDFAHEHAAKREAPHGASAQSGLKAAQHALEEANAPAAGQCAESIGATRFAELHSEIATSRSAEGDFAGAAEAFRAALDCKPRDATLQAAVAGSLFDARDYAGARKAIDTALDIDPRSVEANRLAGNLDFIDEHWADAIARFRYVAASDNGRTHAAYGQLMYWLAQARSGIAHPDFVVRTPTDGWPQPLLLYLRGEYTEAELLRPIRDGDDDSNSQPNTSTDERLCEALFYVGEAYWARGDRKSAQDYFAALVNLRIIYFLEHGLALAEIAKLR
jgi:lipoprotein NlpI